MSTVELAVALAAGDLSSALRTTLSSYKVPRHYYRVVAEPDLPMLPTGKADLVALRSLFAAESQG